MKAFDSDVLVEILSGNSDFVQRAAAIPADRQSVPVVVVEEILRARLNSIRMAEANKGKITLVRAYELFGRSLAELRRLAILPYGSGSDSLFDKWRADKIRVATHDLRIAAICIDHRATLISRNRCDFDQVPGLDVEYWG